MFLVTIKALVLSVVLQVNSTQIHITDMQLIAFALQMWLTCGSMENALGV